MSITPQSAQVYTDFQGLNKMKYAGDDNSPDTLRYVAEQFEAIFLQMMLKSAHGESGEEDALFDNQQTDFYQDWHDKQLAISLAEGRGVGIADMLVQQLQLRNRGDTPMAEGALPLDKVTRQAPRAVTTVKQAAGLVPTAEIKLDSPEAFTRHLWPHAQKAARELGVAPEVILAQAALETGWGKKISTRSNGESSHNLFNIKADWRWQGERVSVPTLEYRNGVAVRETAQFRAYDSFAESFTDFVAFIKSSPRYQQALAVADDAYSFTHALANAGYATDPQYANKIMGIAQGEPLRKALQAIKI
ncbi:MAG TPA: flagellar assembly peptidoglycan hydrolase FlgJ [Gammaproteobacteria bacterium]|nr:flagellar assembly peptidoglycan hydrolase FlgJ [Gammaproteobacteria bacterium]